MRRPAPSRFSRQTRRFALLLPFVAVACKEQVRPQRAAPVVSVDAAKVGPLPYIVTANGTVEPNRTVAVQSLVSGMLTRVAFAEGDEVSRGQVLFEIDPRPFRAEVTRLQSTLARDEVTLARARSDSARFSALAKDGYITRQQLDQTNAEAGSLAATVAAGRASLEAARLALENTVVRAPISGRTGQLSIQAGNLVRQGTDVPLVTINELRPVLVRFTVPEGDFEEMRRRSGLDKPLAVRVQPRDADTSRVLTGTLTFIDNVVDPATGSVLLKARVANESRVLWPGQFVTVGLELSVDEGAVTVPSVAIVPTASGAYVYVMDDASKAKRVPVKVGRTAGTVTKIDSGLTGGERVIVEGQTRLTDGAKVEIRGAPSADRAGQTIRASNDSGARRGARGGSRQ
ncbi:MAG: efflux RND transporter periplasmic adaptor subunit [Gemmatimonadota bacterium]